MRSIGLKALKTKLNECVQLAERGETILVIDQDRVVAEITPPDKNRSLLLAEALLADAVRQGLITPAPLPSTDVPPRKPVTSFRRLKSELDRDRGER